MEVGRCRSTLCLAEGAPYCGFVLTVLHNWPCRDGAFNKTSVGDGVLEVVIVLSDSTNNTEAGDKRKSARFCQCRGERRSSRIVPKATDNRAQQVLVHVHAHVGRNGAVRVMLLETGSN